MFHHAYTPSTIAGHYQPLESIINPISTSTTYSLLLLVGFWTPVYACIRLYTPVSSHCHHRSPATRKELFESPMITICHSTSQLAPWMPSMGDVAGPSLETTDSGDELALSICGHRSFGQALEHPRGRRRCVGGFQGPAAGATRCWRICLVVNDGDMIAIVMTWFIDDMMVTVWLMVGDSWLVVNDFFIDYQ